MQILQFSQSIDAPVAHLYHAFTNAAALQEWFADVAEADARAGGRFYCYWNDGYYTAGVYESVEENYKVVFTWNGLNEPVPTTVEVILKERDGGTEVSLSHSLPGTGAEWDALAKSIKENWPPMLDNLKSVVETGVDLRFYQRPLLGFYVGGLVNDTLKERFNLPIDQGMHVAGVVEGMGAQKSGLQADDVIHTIDGTVMAEFQSLPPVMERHKGGDIVKAVVYRSGEKVELDVELSKRPIPEFPAQPDELAQQAEAVYDDVLADLDAVMAGVSEDVASLAPAKGEWRDRLPEGQKFPPYPGSARTVDAIAQTYTAEALLKELRLSIRLQINLIRSLPEEFSTRKGGYFASANSFDSGVRTHWGQHTRQIETALEAVQKSLEPA
jgi:uncharacterized protein YndB with AHSA1/START domain